MPHYYRVMLGAASVHAAECIAEGFIGTNFSITHDLSADLALDFHLFNAKYIPIYQANFPHKTRIGAGLAMGALWVVSHKIQIGDRVVSPVGGGQYRVGTVTSDYHYATGQTLPHRRAVTWDATSYAKEDFPAEIRGALTSQGTVVQLSRLGYGDALDTLLVAGESATTTQSDIQSFVMEKYLEEFLVSNWSSLPFAKTHDIYTDDTTKGVQVNVGVGIIDILAISKDKKELLVIELKRGQTSDVVLGQILRYMGYLNEHWVDNGQSVRGVIVALEDDTRLRYALKIVPSVAFYRYQIAFSLVKG
jgi:restriction system protein